jgi:hypothetical protein
VESLSGSVKEISELSMLSSYCSSVLDANLNDSSDHKNIVEISPNYEAEINDKLVKKNREVSSLVFPSLSELKADFICYSYEENVEDISVLETYVFSIPSYYEEFVSNIDQEQPIFDEYTLIVMNIIFLCFLWNLLALFLYMMIMSLILGNYLEGGVEGELHMHLISYPSPINEHPCFDKNHVYEQQTVLTIHTSMINSQPKGGSEYEEQPFNQKMISLVLYPPVHAKNIKQHVSNDEIKEVKFYQFSMPCQHFHDPVNEYMELHFSNALEPANFIIFSAFGGYIGDTKNVFSHFSNFYFFLWIICSEENNYVTK